MKHKKAPKNPELPETGAAGTVVSKKKKKKKKKSWISTLILVLIMLAGVGIMAYPTFSDWWNSYHQSRAIASYVAAVESVDQELLDQMIDDARAYNRYILTKPNRFAMPDEELERYNSLLNLSGNGIMGYVRIDSIGVYLPIYHGTEENVLQVAIGHLDWSSLPVGGESTHALLSGHRGLPSAKLFSDLDKLKEGDIFTITVLKQTLTYEIDQIRIVEPQEVSELGITSGKDYCTLITCTPYGINTHRMLLRGHRIENVLGDVVVTPEAIRIPNYLTIPAVGIPLLFLFLLGMVIYYRRRGPKLSEEEILDRLTNEPDQKKK